MGEDEPSTGRTRLGAVVAGLAASVTSEETWSNVGSTRRLAVVVGVLLAGTVVQLAVVLTGLDGAAAGEWSSAQVRLLAAVGLAGAAAVVGALAYALREDAISPAITAGLAWIGVVAGAYVTTYITDLGGFIDVRLLYFFFALGAIGVLGMVIAILSGAFYLSSSGRLWSSTGLAAPVILWTGAHVPILLGLYVQADVIAGLG